ncbi:sigma-70 RNA polymerase sigma factor region 4 domain-containing protein [Robiginitalea sediminis]|uniref:sigma-70 family RNA polymerase sigma factor n=1 Tax=Robiginitalea sediminis TaxID=1982593 RepID=UPI000B4B53ED|nr:sigma-70 family RNA polymerase sigma factor [Robiginitalea sediminis]
MKTTVRYDKRQAEFNQFVATCYPILVELREKDDRKTFNEILLKVLPEVKRYITRGLRLALAKGVISHNKYDTYDFFDQLIIDVFDHLEEVPSAGQFHAWLFKRAEKLLEDMEVEEVFDAVFYDNLDDYSKAELAELDESFSTDGDGDLVLMGEMDDISYKDHHHLLRNIFLDDAHEDLMALTEAENTHAAAQEHLENLLFRMPPQMRSVFELAHEQGFGTAEIAAIKMQSEHEVEKLLERTREILHLSLRRWLDEP